MAKTIEIRPFARDDDRSGFSCRQAGLDRFFEHYAGQNQFKLHLAVTYVAAVEGRIVGFATVAASSIERASVPSARLRKRLPAYLLPVLPLARLGVDTRAQGLGIGKGLLRHVLTLAVEQLSVFTLFEGSIFTLCDGRAAKVGCRAPRESCDGGQNGGSVSFQSSHCRSSPGW